jgi:hypothetical protein
MVPQDPIHLGLRCHDLLPSGGLGPVGGVGEDFLILGNQQVNYLITQYSWTHILSGMAPLLCFRSEHQAAQPGST